MKVLWIGVGVGPKLLQQLKEKGGKLLSAQVSQGNLVAGLDELSVSMDTLNGPNLDPGMLPVIEAETWSRNGTAQDMSVGYRNVKYLNRMNKQKALCAAAQKWAREHTGEKEVTVFIYSMHTPFMAAAWEVKKLLPQTKICLIVPDLPQYMDLKMSRFKKFLKALDWRRIRKYMKKMDRYVLYSRHMADFLQLEEGCWMVMEGSYDPSLLVGETEESKSDTVSVMYSGVLDLRYGIPELLDAMNLLDGSYELWLTGAGNAVDLIKERAAADPRIRFFGFLPSRADLLKKQRSATMLISTRDPSEPASAYCFPSKLFEYMVSGNPVISTRIRGIPDEYFDHLVPLENIAPEDIAHCIETVAKMPEQERQLFGEEARQFILTHKNNREQSRRIKEFIW